jgi:hypothetical protein
MDLPLKMYFVALLLRGITSSCDRSAHWKHRKQMQDGGGQGCYWQSFAFCGWVSIFNLLTLTSKSVVDAG